MAWVSYSTWEADVSTTSSSLGAPGEMVRLRVAVLPATTWTSDTTVRKPGRSTRTSYSPGKSAGALYKPSAFVTAVRATPVALLVMVMFASGTTAPDASVMVPEIIPVGSCAGAENVAHNSRQAATVLESLERNCIARTS